MCNTKPCVLLWLVLFTTLLAGTVYASSSDWGPWDRDRIYVQEQKAAPPQPPRRNFLGTIVLYPSLLLIDFFQTVISPVDGASCDFYPTCSSYAKQALKKHGLFIGLVMAGERLCRIHSPEGYEPIEMHGNYYYYDPVGNNDFWFYKRRTATP